RGAIELPGAAVLPVMAVKSLRVACHLWPVWRPPGGSAVTPGPQLGVYLGVPEDATQPYVPARGGRLSVADRAGKPARTATITELVMAHTPAARAPGSPRRGLAAALGGWSARHRMIA